MASQTTQVQPLRTFKQAAEYCQVDQDTIQTRIRDRLLRYLRLVAAADTPHSIGFESERQTSDDEREFCLECEVQP